MEGKVCVPQRDRSGVLCVEVRRCGVGGGRYGGWRVPQRDHLEVLWFGGVEMDVEGPSRDHLGVLWCGDVEV